MNSDTPSMPSEPTVAFGYRPAPQDAPSLGSAPTMAPGGANGGASSPSEPPSLGRIDQYELIRKLGGGGFGVVYLARDTVSGIDVALKTLHPLMKSNAEEMERLREKFALVSRLSHPNIASALVLHPVREVMINDAAVWHELRLSPGDSVMVMRYAPGVTLSQWRRQFKDGVVPLGAALEVGRQIAAALDYAHDAKIVHRDIKPANVMVETLGGESHAEAQRHREGGASSLSEPQLTTNHSALGTSKIRVRILDFGLAAEIRSSMSRVSSETGDTSGTRPYMAPEQWKGEKQDGRTDQYALACVLYELLSGAPPFAGVFETGDPVAMRMAVEHDLPARLEGVPRHINDVLRKALSKERSDRFGSCGEFVSALGGTGRFRKCRFWLAAAAVAAVVVGLWFASGNNGEASSPNEPPKQGGATSPLPAPPAVEAPISVSPAPPARPEVSPHMLEAPAPPEVSPHLVEPASGPTPEDAKTMAEIARLKADAIRNLQSVREYRKIGDAHFVNRFDELDRAKDALDACDAASDWDRAVVQYAAVTNTVAWLADNGVICGSIEKAKNDIRSLAPALNVVEAQKFAPGTMSKASAAQESAKRLLERGDFAGALMKMEEAKEFCNSAIKEAAESKAEAECKAREEAERLAREEAERKKREAEEAVRREQEAKDAAEKAERERQERERHKAKMGEIYSLDLGDDVKLELVPCPDVARDFWMGKYEVTQEQWEKVMGSNPSYFKNKPKNPVETVSWNDCEEFVKKLNALQAAQSSGLTFRLPTEEEWETACRAGAPKSTDYCKAADGTQIAAATLGKVAWYGEDWNKGSSHPVGAKTANAWGLYDMHGNVWEWTSTAVGVHYELCGGGFDHSADGCTASNRYWYYPSDSIRNLGLRLVAVKKTH